MGRMRHRRWWGPSVVLAGAVAALAVATAFAGTGPTPRSATALGATEPRSVTIDVTRKRQRWDGFGMSERVWADPHLSNNPTTEVSAAQQASILRDLFTRLGLTRVRPVLDQGVQKERGGPFAFGGKLADDHIAFVKQARRFGLRMFYPGPVYLEPWMTESDVDAAAEWAMTMLNRWKQQGLEPPYYSPQNEPQVDGNSDPDFMRRLVIELGQRMRKASFKTKLVVPDDENPIDAYRRASAILTDPQARKYVGAVAYHVYRIGDTSDIVRMGQLAARYGLPVWMTEYSDTRYGAWPDALDWAARMHTLIVDGRVSAVDYLWGFFGSWQQPATMVSLDFENGIYRGKTFTPVYWLTGQWSRYVRPGYRRVAATPEADGILTSAFTGPGKVVVVSVNPGHDAKAVRYSLARGQAGRTVVPVRTTAEESWRSLAPIRVRGSTFTAQLPPRSVTTFVATTPVKR